MKRLLVVHHLDFSVWERAAEEKQWRCIWCFRVSRCVYWCVLKTQRSLFLCMFALVSRGDVWEVNALLVVFRRNRPYHRVIRFYSRCSNLWGVMQTLGTCDFKYNWANCDGGHEIWPETIGTPAQRTLCGEFGPNFKNLKLNKPSFQ